VYDENSKFYETFYADGGWSYSFWREWWWHRKHFIQRFNIPRGAKVLEAACGAGFHTNLFNRMGLRCVGVDASETGIRWARECYPTRTYICADVRGELPLPAASFDVVVTRGCGLYHYDLASPEAMETTPCLMRYLRPGGLLVLIIVTDLSGRKEEGKIWQNTLEDYRTHFTAFTPQCTVDWHKGVAICAARKPVDGLPSRPDQRLVTPTAADIHPVSRPRCTTARA